MRKFPTLTPFRAGSFAHDPDVELRLGLSESPHGAAPGALAAAREQVKRAHLYPHSDGEPLRSVIARHYGLVPDQVVVGNGADEMLMLAALALAEPGDPAVTTSRSFGGHHAALEIAGLDVLEVPIGLGVDVEAIIAALPGARLVMFANPHNPTGSALGRRDIDAVVDAAAAAGIAVILDEAYAEFASDSAFGSGLEALHDRGNVVVIRTFSKAYGLAGLRCGYALGSSDLISAMATVRTVLPFNTSRVALAAAEAGLADQAHLTRVVSETMRDRETLRAGLEQFGVETLPSQTNFVLASVGEGAADVVAALNAEGIVLRDAGALGYPGWIRIGVPTSAQLPRLLRALAAVLPVHGDEERER